MKNNNDYIRFDKSSTNSSNRQCCFRRQLLIVLIVQLFSGFVFGSHSRNTASWISHSPHGWIGRVGVAKKKDTAWESQRTKKSIVQRQQSLLQAKQGLDNDNGRRQFLQSLVASSSLLASFPQKAYAKGGLVQFPCKEPLGNTYHFMTTGLSLLEEEDIWTTNPLFLTNREAALSPKGVEQVENACQLLKSYDRTPTQVRYSLAANAIDTATILGRELDLGRNILLPEYTFLDPRGIGQWEATSYSKTMKAIIALDELEAGPYGDGAKSRPPPNIDGTPNETLADQAIRLRQILSILETQCSGDTILLVFPDGTGPAVLSAMIGGIPLNHVHQLEFYPGEVRLDINYKSVQELYRTRSVASKEYEQTIQEGKLELEKLQSTTSIDDIVNIKDEKIEQERLAVEEAERVRANERLLEQEKKEKERRKRQEQMSLETQLQRNANADSFGRVPPVALGAAGMIAVGGVGTAVGLGHDEDGTKKNQKEELLVASTGNGVGMISTSGMNGTMSTLSMASDTVTLQQQEEDVAPITIEKLDPFEAAEKAMEDYMNSDDGAEDWLKTLSEMIVEDVDEDTNGFE